MGIKRKKLQVDLKNSNVSFEYGMKRLEEIVQKMEDSDLPLEDTMKFYEEGILLIKKCRKKLQEAESKIQVLEKTSLEMETDSQIGGGGTTEENNNKLSKSGVKSKKINITEENGKFMVDERLQGTLLYLDEKS